MGVYLSTPCTDMTPESGEGYGLRYIVGDIQGWRKNMEDAHIACTDLALINPSVNNDSVSVFAVFDGHGGKEVAKWCQLYFLRELVATEEFYKRKFGEALIKTFHKMDEMLEEESNDFELSHYRRIPNPSDIQSGSDEDGEVKNNKMLLLSPGLQYFEAMHQKEIQRRLSVGNTTLLEPIDTSSEVRLPATVAIGSDSNKDNEHSSQVNIAGMTQSCKLNDHRLIAGCTSVVALKYGNQLIVANAGDSRAVLCRANGEAYALSEDHKPHEKVEIDRIHAAGGFVNSVGRINGNLNLSRAIGDLKYKQHPSLTRDKQIITAEPDITVTDLLPDDRFFVLACDGVWDCFTNEQLCKFVYERLEDKMSLHDILVDIFSFCVSRDPRETGGVGGDNMTCILVELLNNTNSNN